MTRDEIIRMAREAGLCIDGEVAFSPNHDGADVDIADLQTFAALVVAAEREACAEICDHEMDNAMNLGMKVASGNCADKIRARGNHEKA